VGEKARERGLRLAYHNHSYDSLPLDGEQPFDLVSSPSRQLRGIATRYDSNAVSYPAAIKLICTRPWCNS